MPYDRAAVKPFAQESAAVSKLTAAMRNKLPASKFAGPNDSYPVNDPPHAVNAKARATQQENKGNLSPAAAARIRAKANRVLDKDHDGA